MNNQNHVSTTPFERDFEEQSRQRAAEELAQRERDHSERQERDRLHREQHQAAPAHQNNTGAIHIHQPVANRLPTAIHSPGGLLANHGSAGPPPAPLGMPSGPGNAFGGPLQSDNNRTIQHNLAQNVAAQQQQQLFGSSLLLQHAGHQNVPFGVPGGPPVGTTHQQLHQQQQDAAARLIPFGGPLTPHQMPGATMGQGGQPGQQPILNDALSYLDQVKVQFADQSDVYNKFLDIMKDFKSQAIDTPGVINRVSELFAGHPNLIQGFNTFLPPGYRIECGTGSDPNTIRVTTPMGTTVQSITGSGCALPEGMGGSTGGAGPYPYGAQRGSNWQPRNSVESPETVFSPQHQPAAPAYAQNQGALNQYDVQQQASNLHQQQQRGVSQLSNAVNLIQPTRDATSPTHGGPGSINGINAQVNLEKRGPVEFNHAISYVNKIKNRFQDKPEIYKQFLEILQTYQRESKPIQDVYAQVTELFKSAPDLLEDFKQFLPESAAHAKAAAKAAEENLAALASQSQLPNNTRGEGKGPPIGNFSVSLGPVKDNKKGKRGSNMVNGSLAQGSDNFTRVIIQNQPNKRMKTNHAKAQEAPAVSPTLTPAMPEPLPGLARGELTSEELSCFDRVRKYIGNKSTMNEFLKLCNLFSQDLIDRDWLLHKVSVFLGGNADLMNSFRILITGQGQDDMIDNRPKPPSERVALSNCRGLGPSYRLLPKRERLKPCSGRDEMCNEVLNDDWASHPTWASEDSGFVAHRKNAFEEGLHRIEEERHDYDFNIEVNAKVIQLLEPIAQSLLSLVPGDKDTTNLSNMLCGQSPAIYKRVLKKIYGVERGPDVVNDLFRDPAAVLPVVLARLKQKDEEWRLSQREWEKVWHAQTQVMYPKSLDHMGLQVRQLDKKNFIAKHLIDSIKTKHEQQKRQRGAKGPNIRYQFEHEFRDKEVLCDILRLMIVFAINTNSHNSAERARMIEFFEKFISTFFDISDDLLDAHLTGIDRGSLDDEDEVASNELPNGRGKRTVNGKRPDLRRGVLDRARNGTRTRGQKEDSSAGSKESSPDLESAMDEEMGDVPEDQSIEVTNERWGIVPEPAATNDAGPVEDIATYNVDEPFQRSWYSLYCNQTIFVFFGIFQTLYMRFEKIKECEPEVKAAAQRSSVEKPAHQIGLVDAKHSMLLLDDGDLYYDHTIMMVEDFLKGDIDENKYQEYLRIHYLMQGWQIYTIADLLKALCRLGAACCTNDKEKTSDLVNQFFRDREVKETSYNHEINLRKQADKYIKDGELFLIRWHPGQNVATTQWIPKDQATWDLDDLERKERWQYYVSSYIRIEPTEGVNRRLMKPAVLSKLLPKQDTTDFDDAVQRKPLVCNEDLTMRICVHTSKIVYDKDSGAEYFIYTDKELGGDAARKRLQKFEDTRNNGFRDLERNARWMRNMSHEQVQTINQTFQEWVKDDGAVPRPL